MTPRRDLFLLVGAAMAAAPLASAQVRPHAGMLQNPDVGPTHIVFVFQNDLWIAPKAGGIAEPLASPPGQEQWPRFSPDGKSIAFVGNYEGDRDLYTISVDGGVPKRVTHHPANEWLNDWTAQGLLYFAGGTAGLGRQTELFLVSPEGGLPTKLPPPYGAMGAISPNGDWLAYTPHTRDTRTWKRYRGGMATDIWLLNLKNGESRQITDWEGTDTQPMWVGDTVYYLSDNGDEHKLNIWSFNTTSGERRQVTRFSDFDCKWPSVGPGRNGRGEIVFQNGADLCLFDIGEGQSRVVDITIPGDRPKIAQQQVDVSDKISWWNISPTGKRVVVSARGDVWTLPAEKGSPRQLTDTDGVFERDPNWSPDGRWIAYLSDETGEYELYITQSDGRGETRRLTDDGAVFRYNPVWSPDSEKLAYTDKTGKMWLVDVESGDQSPIDTDPFAWDGSTQTIAWSHDSRWIAYDKSGAMQQQTSVWVYSVEDGSTQQITSGFFGDHSPTFDRVGDYLYYVSNRHFSPQYGALDTTFIYPDAEAIIAVPLREDVKSPWLAKSDEEEWKKDDAKKDEDKDEGDEEGDDEGDEAGGDEDDGGDEPADEDADDAKKDAAADDGVSGTWTLELSGEGIPPGGMTATLNMTVSEDGDVSGSVESPMGSGSITSGTYDKGSGALSLTIDANGAVVTINATIAGGTLTGTVESAEAGIAASVTGSRTSAAGGDDGDDDKKKGKEGEPREEVEILVDGFEARGMQLPIKPGSFRNLSVNSKDQLIYVRGGGRGESPSIKLFDLKDDKKEEKDVASGGSYELSGDRKKLLVLGGGSGRIQDASAGATAKPVPTGGMLKTLDPRAEWKQLFADAWRIQRDFFYDAGLHGVDWPAIRDRYAAMLEDCVSREDVGFVIAEMISELNVGHAYYRGGGDVESQPSISVGMLGCDFELAEQDGASAYRIAKIYEGAAWDSDARGPLSQPGVDVKEGDFLLAVNGRELDTSVDPWAAFIGTTGRAITLTVSEKPTWDEDARDVVVETISSDGDLRYRAWIERNRKHVEEASNGRIGYIYVPDTGVNGQNNLVRQYYGQIQKDALIIDERWNGGGQIPTRFIEMLNRPVTNYWARRDGKDWVWPPDAHQGPKAMLINGLAGSGGDAFPHYFRQAGIGKLIGMRTWGGLVGIHGNPGLIDGSGITVPTFGFYESDGTWGIEGHGVDPDIRVVDDPAMMIDGGDPQLDAAINHLLGELERAPYRAPARPTGPNRSGMGIEEGDK